MTWWRRWHDRYRPNATRYPKEPANLMECPPREGNCAITQLPREHLSSIPCLGPCPEVGWYHPWPRAYMMGPARKDADRAAGEGRTAASDVQTTAMALRGQTKRGGVSGSGILMRKACRRRGEGPRKLLISPPAMPRRSRKGTGHTTGLNREFKKQDGQKGPCSRSFPRMAWCVLWFVGVEISAHVCAGCDGI
jgi:hypothetical protein